MSATATEILSDRGNQMDEILRAIIRQAPRSPSRLIESIEYSVFAGGKRLRPALLLECAAALNGHSTAALFSACAVELIHTFSLVHDDLPAMDDDDLRRGRATNHKVFGEAMAILAGDAMVALAFGVIAREAGPDLAGTLVRELSTAAGASGMIGGQARDIEGENRELTLDDLREVHRMKTGALITASCRMGAICAHANERNLTAITNFGEHLGLAFQIADDLLDQTATPEQIGKNTRKDASRGKNTFAILLGQDAARMEAEKELAMSLAALQSIDGNTENLATLARFAVHRDR